MKVVLKKIESYSSEKISQFINDSGIDILLKNGDKVLLKPNLLSFKKIDSCVNTHPEFFKGVVEFFKNYNVKIYVGDSPGFGTLKGNLKISGYSEIIKKYGILIYNFNKKIEVKNYKNKILKRFKISDAVDFDYIVNLPKLKTHCMMGLTLSVKNCYGFIVGKDKISYHLKAGHDKLLFADILIDIFETVKPDINIIDGIWGMQGDGPSSGEPFNFKIIGISKCGYSLDYVIEQIVCFPTTFITNQALKRNLFNPDKIKMEFLGEKIEAKKIKPPKSTPANFRAPKFVSNIIYPKPKIIVEKCKKCYSCVNSCPVKAIYDDKVLKIDYKKCIKCYCCHELCIYEAIKL